MTYMIAAELKMIERNKIQVYIFKVKAIIKCTYKNLGIKSQKLTSSAFSKKPIANEGMFHDH